MNKNWKELVKNDLEKVLANYSNKQLNFKLTSPKWHALGVLFIILGVIPGLILFYFIKKAERIKFDVLEKLNIEKYYETAFAQESDGEFMIKNNPDDFELLTKNLIPIQSASILDPFLSIDSAQCNYLFGTITEQIIAEKFDNNGNWSRQAEYFRSPFLMVVLDKPLEFDAFISESKSFFKIFKTKENTELEVIQFKKMYAIESSDQVLIRKLLTPKVIANLVDLGIETKKIPNLNINNNIFAYKFESFWVEKWQSPTGIIGMIDFNNQKNQILEDIYSKITNDYETFITNKKWFDIYQIYKN